jgi:hypothetical protein
MELKELAALFVLPLLLNACSTAPKSVLTGAVIGGVAGAGLGQSQNSQAAVIGSLIGYSAFNDKQKKSIVNTSAKNENKNENTEDYTPFITRPKIRSYIVPDTIEGNKFIKSHRIFILDDAGSWSKD